VGGMCLLTVERGGLPATRNKAGIISREPPWGSLLLEENKNPHVFYLYDAFAYTKVKAHIPLYTLHVTRPYL
jgi:hypothetical protein